MHNKTVYSFRLFLTLHPLLLSYLRRCLTFQPVLTVVITFSSLFQTVCSYFVNKRMLDIKY